MQKRSLASFFALLIAMALAGPAAIAAGGGGSDPVWPAAPEDPNYTIGKKAAEAMDWQVALEAFEKVAAKEPSNANAQNYLGYVNRKMGKLDLAFKYYDEALRLDPKHKGAHEYVGEAYLMAGNVAKAEEHLQALDRICFFSCEEFRDLKKAIAEYRVKNASK
jgi:tetratricopeptide (TPR) repeat protein